MAPELPLGLPAAPVSISIPAAVPKPPARTRSPRHLSGVPAVSDNHTVLQVVPIGRIAIDPRFGLEETELARRYAAAVSAEVERIEAEIAQPRFPSVTVSEDGQYLAFSDLPTIFAARQVAGSEADVAVTVIVCATVASTALLTTMFAKPLGHSLFEQARYIQGCERHFGSRRAWMRADGIDPQKWETRFSKVGKINQLDEALLGAIDPHTITSTKDAGRIVDLYADRTTRRSAEAVIASAQAKGGQPLNASRLFKAIIAAAGGMPPAPSLRLAEDGSAVLIDAAGKVLGNLSRDGDRWSLGDWDADTLTPAMVTLALRHARRTCSGASLQGAAS